MNWPSRRYEAVVTSRRSKMETARITNVADCTSDPPKNARVTADTKMSSTTVHARKPADRRQM